jgi:hypothetical protein
MGDSSFFEQDIPPADKLNPFMELGMDVGAHRPPRYRESPQDQRSLRIYVNRKGDVYDLIPHGQTTFVPGLFGFSFWIGLFRKNAYAWGKAV